MHNIHAGGITKKEFTNMLHRRIIDILFHEQAVYEWDRKMEKSYFKSVINITIWFNCSLAGLETIFP